METWMWIISGVVGLASLITAITVIVKAFKNVSAATQTIIKEQAREVVKEEQATTLELNKFAIDQLKDTIFKVLDVQFEKLEGKLTNISKKLDKFTDEQKETNRLLTQGHLETWKNDIRSIYYSLRETGEISDNDKSYIDKIYHVYKELGGNSDIDAKYNEISEVYAMRTKERYTNKKQN